MADCDLCEAARITPWFYEDDLCWIAECEICATPMVVWREHDANPAPDVKSELHVRLAAVVEEYFSFEHYVDDNMRNIPDHYHAHACPSAASSATVTRQETPPDSNARTFGTSWSSPGRSTLRSELASQARRRPDAASRSPHGSSVRGELAPELPHRPVTGVLAQALAEVRRRLEGTPRPAHTSCAWRISSSPARGTKSAGGRVSGFGPEPDDRPHIGSATVTTAARMFVAVRSPSTSRCRRRFGAERELARRDSGRRISTRGTSPVRSPCRPHARPSFVQLHSSVPAGTDQSWSRPFSQPSPPAR